MRFKMEFELEYPNLNIQYRKCLISFIKHSIEEYDENLFKEMYKNNNKKVFAFATALDKPQFEGDNIKLASNKFYITFTAYKYMEALHIYNSFLMQKEKKFSLNNNSMVLKRITMISEKEIATTTIDIKMFSPIVCRNHDRQTLKDMYYAFDREEFNEFIKINIREQMENENLDKSLLNNFSITPINAKKVIVKLYEKKIETSVGTFRLEGDIELLKYLYKAGIGSKRAMGFGCFDII